MLMRELSSYSGSWLMEKSDVFTESGRPFWSVYSIIYTAEKNKNRSGKTVTRLYFL